MHDATEQNQGEIFTSWSQGHRTVALWQRSFRYTKGGSSSKGLILKIMLQTGFQSIVSLPQNGNTKVALQVKRSSQPCSSYLAAGF